MGGLPPSTGNGDGTPDGAETPAVCLWSEVERLAALDRYAILDTPPEPGFDDLVQLAADICDTPIGLLALVARDRQWFKAEVGLGLRETPLIASICARLLLQPGLTVIPDLTKDERSSGNPLVTGEPSLRFYAGVLLVTPDGMPLGTLCVLDTQPRPEGLTPWQARALTTLAHQAMDGLELRRLLIEQEEAERRDREAARERARVVLDSISDGVFALDADWRFSLFNRAAEQFLQKPRRQVIGRPFSEAFPAALPATLRRFRKVMKTRRVLSFETEIGTRPGSIVEMRAAPMDGGIAVSFTDITEQKHAAEAQKVLIAELQHRTRNLLAIVRSISVQTMTMSKSPKAFRDAFDGRLSALGRVQSLLAQGSGASVPLRDLIVAELTALGAAIDGNRISIAGPRVRLKSRAVQTVALALHELATNALKYGALGQPQARLSVRWRLTRDAGRRVATITWVEEGVVLPPQAGEGRRGFGLELIEHALPFELGARSRFSFTPGGIRCEFQIGL